MGKKKDYEKDLVTLQIELLKLQRYIIDNKKRLIIIMEGRDAAGKGGTILRLTQHLNPRNCRVVALNKPDDKERGEWYFQRYIREFPTAGEIVIFDRSYYNRGGVEPVMGYCSEEEHQKFLREVSQFEKILTDDGIILLKFYLSIEKSEQADRFKSREKDPLKKYKLSINDKKAQELWDDYTVAKYSMMIASNTEFAPWTVVYSDNKKEARLNVIKCVLSEFDYPDKLKDKKFLKPDKEIIHDGKEIIEEMSKNLDHLGEMRG